MLCLGIPNYLTLRLTLRQIGLIYKIRLEGVIISMKKIVFCFLLTFSFYTIFGQTAPDWLWTQRGGGSFIDTGYSIATDSSGNSYVTGPFYYDASFGTASITSNGEADMFVAKLDSEGNWLWAVGAGGTWDDYGYGYGIAVDAWGNCYVSGYFYDNAVFGADTLNGAGNYDCYVAKLDTNGNWLWARRAGGLDYDAALSLDVDTNGNCYITGWFSATADFGSTNLTSTGGWDIFTAKLDTDGNWLWAAGAGSSYNSGGLGISVDNFGNSYITGTYEDTIMVGSDSLSCSGYNDVFVAKLDTNGNWLWAKRAGGTGNEVSSGAIVDNSGNCYVSGYFNGTADFSSTLLTSNGNYDAFAAKIDANGNWLWAVNAGGTGNDYANALELDRNNCCIFLTGSFYNAAQFGTNFLTSSGESDIFVARLDADGNWLWTTRGGGASSEEGLGISTDGKGNCYMTGEFYNDIQFGAMTLTGNGNSDVYVVKLAGPTPKAPQNLVISAIGIDIRLTWNHVMEDKDGQPLTLDYYEIYYCQDHPYGDYISLGQVSDTTFVHSGAALSGPGFYYVRAVIAD